jgi:hypothetical protein
MEKGKVLRAELRTTKSEPIENYKRVISLQE